jgi:hypothetical protein
MPPKKALATGATVL